jgi:hypothetical protein
MESDNGMADQESSGFTVVDRRRGTSESTEDTEADASSAPSETPADSGTGPAATAGKPSQNDSPSSEEPPSAADQDAAAESPVEGFMPDPATLLMFAAMQMDTRRLAAALLGIFDGHAWRAMGMVANPQTGEIERDMPSAQLAIDCVQFLLSKIESSLAEAERREVQRRLTDLRMNYLAKLRESGT